MSLVSVRPRMALEEVKVEEEVEAAVAAVVVVVEGHGGH